MIPILLQIQVALPDQSFFLSTLSQTAGAIVGLLGAITISILIHRIGENKKKREELKKMFITVKHRVSAERLHIHNWDEYLDQILLEIKQARDPGGTGTVRLRYKYSIGQAKETLDEIEATDALRQKFEKDKEKIKKYDWYYEVITRGSEVSQIYNSIMGKIQRKIYKIPSDRLLYTNMKELREYYEYKSGLIPPTIWILISSILLLSVSSVFIPMCLLFTITVSLKIYLMVLFGIGIAGLDTYLIIQTIQILRQHEILLDDFWDDKPIVKSLTIRPPNKHEKSPPKQMPKKSNRKTPKKPK